MNRGDVATGVINQYYWYRLELELGKKAIHSGLYYFAPGDVGAVINISGAAILESSDHQKNAERFVSFLVSKEGQQIIAASDDFEYPVHPDVAPNAALPPLSSIGHTSLSVAPLGNGELAARLIRQAGLVYVAGERPSRRGPRAHPAAMRCPPSRTEAAGSAGSCCRTSAARSARCRASSPEPLPAPRRRALLRRPS